MPPRYAYWTILIDRKPTAFRSRERAELLPTLHQLRRKNTDVVLMWFARGRLWESPAEADRALRAPRPPVERRGRDWRPGGTHRDPRDRFKKRPQSDAGHSHSTGGKTEGRSGDRRPFAPRRKPVSDRKSLAPRGSAGPEKPWQRDQPNTRRRFAPPADRKPEASKKPPAGEPIPTDRKPPEPK